MQMHCRSRLKNFRRQGMSFIVSTRGLSRTMVSFIQKTLSLNRLWNAAGCAGWLAIMVLSLVPGSSRPHSGASGLHEHFAAYALVGAAFGAGLLRLKQRLLVAVGLTLTAAALEILQAYVPERNAEFAGFISGAAGALAGIAVMAVVSGLARRQGMSGQG